MTSEYQPYPVRDPFEDGVGPFLYTSDADGFRAAFQVEPAHCNSGGTVHGGMLMTFADFALCAVAVDGYSDEYPVTVSFSSEFVGAAKTGEFVEFRGEVTRRTGTMAFTRGQIHVGDRVLMNCSAVIRRFPRSD